MIITPLRGQATVLTATHPLGLIDGRLVRAGRPPALIRPGGRIDAQGNSIDLVRWVRKRGSTTREVTGGITHEQQSYPVRLVATRFPPQQAVAARAHKAKTAWRK